jgi:hypothetical protein
MPCCTPNITFFYDASETSVAYTQPLRDVYGSRPSVFVYYWDEGLQEYIAAGIFTEIKLTGNPVDTIAVNHGGSGFQGFVKIE